MDLTSPVWAVSAGVLAVIAIGVTVYLATRRHWTTRFGTGLGIVLSVLLVLTSIGLTSNIQMGWVSDWESLRYTFGSDTGTRQPAKIVKPQVEPGAQLPEELAPSDDPQWKLDLRPAPSEHTETARWTGPNSNVTTAIEIWTPPDYSPNDGKEYGVIEFLHGYPGSPTGVVDALELDRTWEKLGKTGKVKPYIVVIPDLVTRKGEPDCINFKNRPPIETWVTADVPKAIRSTYPNVSGQRDRWLLAGISSGAYCAANLMTRHLDTYGAAAALSGYDQPMLGSFEQASSPVRKANVISSLVQRLTYPARLYLGGTQTDEDSVEVIENVERKRPPKLDLETTIDTRGGHTWTTWARQLPNVLTWWDRGAPERADSSLGPDGTNNATGDVRAGMNGLPGARGIPQTDESIGMRVVPRESVALFSFRGIGLITVVWLVGAGLTLAASIRRKRLVPAIGLVLAAVIALAVASLLSLNAYDGFFASFADFRDGWRALFP
ncbi:MAG: alpha/beta hydrolase-fold protein [Actinomycetaceae bacterium]|nr:alpha/beta hydrolase-fold protein [Actinomycetaceae bacterium]